MHACVRALWLLVLLVWCGCEVRAVVYHTRLHFELDSLTKSKYVADYWRNVSHSGKEGGLQSAVAMLTLPQEGLTKYYKVIMNDSFYMDTEGVIRISVHDPIHYDVTALRQYIDGFKIPTDSTHALHTHADTPLQTPSPPQTTTTTVNYVGRNGEVRMSNAATYFYLNQPLLHCIYNAPPITQMILSGTGVPQYRRSGDAAADAVREDETKAERQGKSSPSSKSNRTASEESGSFVNSDSGGAYQEDSSNTSSSTATIPAVNVSTCLAYMPPMSSLRPPQPIDYIDKEFMRRSALLLLKVFDADVWVKLTHQTASRSIFPTREVNLLRTKGNQRRKDDDDDDDNKGIGSEGGNSGDDDDDDDEITVNYNPVIDTAKLCSAPAMYTISLSSLYNTLEQRAARRAARATAMNAHNGYDDPDNGDDDDDDDDEDEDDEDDVMITLSHIYQPVRMVVVVVQCSAVPLHLNLTVELVNSNGRELSGQYFTLQTVTIVFLIFYSLLFVIFLILLLPLPCWRQRRAATPAPAAAAAAVHTQQTRQRRHQLSASHGSDVAAAREEEGEGGEAHERGFARADYVTALYRDEAARSATPSRSRTRQTAEEDVHRAPSIHARRSARRTEAQTNMVVDEPRHRSHHHNYNNNNNEIASSEDGSSSSSSTSSSTTRYGGRGEGLRLGAVVRDIRRSCRVVRHWWAAHEMIFMYTPLQVLLGILLPLKCLTCAVSVVSVSVARRDSLSSGLMWQFTVNVISVVLDTALFTLEMLVAMGWAVAYEGGLPTAKTVIVGVCTTIALVLHILAIFCPDSIDMSAFTVNKSSRAMMSVPCRVVNYMKVGYGILIHLYNLYELMRLTTTLGRQCTQMGTTALNAHKTTHHGMESSSSSNMSSDVGSGSEEEEGSAEDEHGDDERRRRRGRRRQRGYVTRASGAHVRRGGRRGPTRLYHSSNSDDDGSDEEENVRRAENGGADTPLRRTGHAASSSSAAHRTDYRTRHEHREATHRGLGGTLRDRRKARRRLSSAPMPTTALPSHSSAHRRKTSNSTSGPGASGAPAGPHARWHVRHYLPSHRLAQSRLCSASERRARVAVQVSRHCAADKATRHAALLASADEAQLKCMELYLRYHSMTAPFAFLSLMSLLYVVLSLSFYQPEDRYMTVAFNELLIFYLLGWTLVFLRKKPYVY